MVFGSEEKSKKDGLDVFAMGKEGREQNMEWGEEGRKLLQMNPVILKSLFSSNMACDYLSLNQ